MGGRKHVQTGVRGESLDQQVAYEHVLNDTERLCRPRATVLSYAFAALAVTKIPVQFDNEEAKMSITPELTALELTVGRFLCRASQGIVEFSMFVQKWEYILVIMSQGAPLA